MTGGPQASQQFGPTLMKGTPHCLTRARRGSGGYYLVKEKRMMFTQEMFRLQGVPDGRLSTPPGVSEREMRMMIGNAFDVNVFKRLVCRTLRATYLAPRHLVDPAGERSINAAEVALHDL